MLITVSCPHCQTCLRVNEELRGELLSCPNCKDVFPVVEDLQRAPTSSSVKPGRASSSGKSKTGTVGDLIPILPAESSASAEPAPTASWLEPPPVRRSPTSDTPPPQTIGKGAEKKRPAETIRMKQPPPPSKPRTNGDSSTSGESRKSGAAKKPAIPDNPVAIASPQVELPAWEPPPVRRAPSGVPETLAAQAAEPPLEVESDEPALDLDSADPAPPSRRGSRALILVSLVFCVILAGGYFFFRWALSVTEVGLLTQAQKDYDDHRLEEARLKFHRLEEQFAESDQVKVYQLVQEVCQVRQQLEDNGLPPAESFDALQGMLKQHGNNPLLTPYHGDLANSWTRRLLQFPNNAQPCDPATTGLIERASAITHEVSSRWKALNAAELGKIEEDLNQMRQEVRLCQLRERYLKDLEVVANQPSNAARKEAQRLIKQAEQEGVKGFGLNPKVTALLQKIVDGHRDAVVYKRVDTNLDVPRLREDQHGSFVINVSHETNRDRAVAPLGQALKDNGDGDARVVLALVRGVLYGLRRSDGATLWATRVGVDTRILPVRVPATDATPELFLVLSADTGTLTAMDRAGRPVWQYRLGNKCVARPVVVDQRAYLPTLDGQVHEIELFEGKLLGRFELGAGEKLTVGGTREGKSNRIYFPADDNCVYVLDVVEKKCVGILYTNHFRASLRGEPIVVPPEDPQPGYLILNQQQGLDDMLLRVYSLPITDPNAAPISLNPPLQVRGWSWFPPCRDDEKMALVSDSGVIGLFGIKQPRNQDQALFPFFPAGPLGLSLDHLLPGKVGEPHGRSQVVQMQDDDFWVLAHGRLQRLQMGWKSAAGPQLRAVWREPRDLGWQEHECQVFESPVTHHSTLFLVTQVLHQSTMLATAVDDEDGSILWQRQLGLVAQSEPLSLTPPEAGEATLLLAQDQASALLSFDATELPPLAQRKNVPFWHGGKQIAGPLDENVHFPPQLLLDADGHSAWQVACPGKLHQLHLRKIGWKAATRGLEEKRPGAVDRVVPLSAAPAGPAQKLGNYLLIPLDSGILVRVSLKDGHQVDEGPSWRAPRRGPGTPGHVLALGEELVLLSDGLDGLSIYRWPAVGGGTRELGAEKMGSHRLITAPILVPGRKNQILVALAEANGTLNLFEVYLDKKQWNKLQTWKLDGRITAGPFTYTLPGGESRIACVLEDRRLMWLDPEAKEPAWDYQHPDLAVVGTPHLVEGVLVLADKTGRVVGLDPATGKEVGPETLLQGSVVAAVSPVAFGPGLLFAPLTDGTVLLLPSPKK